MILEWMLYTIAVTLLFAWAAWALEEIAVSKGFPARLIWIAAVVGSLLLPQALHLRPRTGPSVTISIRGVAMPWETRDRDAARPAESAPNAVAARDIDAGVKIVWGGSSALVLLVFGGSAALVARRRRRWQPQVLNRRKIWISADTGPAVVGFFPGEIVLPEWILTSPLADRRLAVTHEEEHIRSRDPLIVFGIAIACAAMPWNLPLWWIASRLRRAIELDCDRRLVEFGFNRRSYSRLLIEVTERGLPHYMVVTGMSGTPSFLEKRIRLLLGRKPQSSIRSGALAMAASLVLFVAYSIDPPAGLAEKRPGAAKVPGLSVEGAVEIFEVAASAVLGANTGAAAGPTVPAEIARDTLPLEEVKVAVTSPSSPSSAETSRMSSATPGRDARGEHVYPARMAGDREIQVCVVDNGQLSFVTANYREATGDTLLGNVRFADFHRMEAPNYAGGSEWLEEKREINFVQPEQTASENSTWVPFGVTRTLQPNQLKRIGELNGVPVFGEAGRRLFNVIYIPVKPGCVFQPYQGKARIRY